MTEPQCWQTPPLVPFLTNSLQYFRLRSSTLRVLRPEESEEDVDEAIPNFYSLRSPRRNNRGLLAEWASRHEGDASIQNEKQLNTYRIAVLF